MIMNCKQTILSFLVALPTFTLADEVATLTTPQNINLTIPLVALIDVENISPTFTFTAPTDAGTGFSNADDVVSSVALTSNNPAARLDVHISNNLDGIDLGIKDMVGICNQSSLSAPLSTTSQSCDMGTRQTTNGSFTITASPAESGNGMIPYGSYTTDIIYTITEN
jgi:hypothetical protein